MDTFSHAIVGIAAAGLSGHAVSLSDPIYLAALIGSQAPDFDILAYANGKLAYLEKHRSFSHSIPGILMWSTLTAFGFSLLFSYDFNLLLNVFFWCFLSSLFHVALDYLNTHGVAFLWPYSKMRYSLNLLNVFDPCLMIMWLLVLALKPPPVAMSAAIFSILCGYIIFRYFLRRKSSIHLARMFGDVHEALVMPSLKSILFWDFIIKTPCSIYVGQLGALKPVLSIRAKLPREKISDLVKAAKDTSLGKFFSEFTPYSYFKEDPENNNQNDAKTVRAYDLRYCFEKGFAYSAAIIFNSGNLPCSFNIYAYGKKIKTPFF